MSVGFTHGVLNTDNLSLASITIDYGPFGFLEAYDPNFTPNHSDDSGRYDYESQPEICFWNLDKLATALTPILSNTKHQQLRYLSDFLFTKDFFFKIPHNDWKLKCPSLVFHKLNALENYFSKFYGKVGVISWLLFHLI